MIVNRANAYSLTLIMLACVATLVTQPTWAAEVGSADVHVMVFPGGMLPQTSGDSMGEDHVTFTYAREVSDQDAQRDFLAYSKVSSRTLHQVQVTTGRTPLSGASSPKMTCTTFTTLALIRPGAGHFDIEPFIVALKAYRHIRLSFIVPAGYTFSGLRTYKDRYVSISVDPQSSDAGATYTYDVHVIDPSFKSLNLPTWQASPEAEKTAAIQTDERKRLAIKIVGIILIGGIAAVAGYFVYSAVAAKTPTP